MINIETRRNIGLHAQKCGSKDKHIHRKMLDNHRAHAELDTVKCEDCGYIFFVNDSMDEDEKKELLKELNKYYG